MSNKSLSALLFVFGIALVAVGFYYFVLRKPLKSMLIRSGTWPVPGRQQWDENGGYCGETSMISAGLRLGQYFSQFDARAIASKSPKHGRFKPRLGRRISGKSRNEDGSCDSPPGPPTPCSLQQCQLLIGDNDAFTASQMRLTSESWDPTLNTDPGACLVWMKQHLAKGNTVIFVVYVNQNLFFGDTDPCAGQCDYDHIVVAEKVVSTHPNDGQYYGDDVLWFSDNGEYPDGSPQYYFSSTFDNFPATRGDANDPDNNPYSLPNNVADPNICPYQIVGSYAIAITGVEGAAELMPVTVTTSKNYESPEIVDGGNTRPASMPLTLTVTVSNLVPNTQYNLYMYNDETKVPISNFNSHAKDAAMTYHVLITSGSTYTMTANIKSSDKVIYRCCKA